MKSRLAARLNKREMEATVISIREFRLLDYSRSDTFDSLYHQLDFSRILQQPLIPLK